MQKDKHNIYSKEELLKLIKEGKNAPADIDEFEREALEGLKLLDKPDVLSDLDAEIDSIVAKEKNRKTIYYFSVAASLVLIIGLVLFFKNEVAPDITKSEKPIASAENLKKPEGFNPSNTITPSQSETQTTYEAKEPEAIAQKITAAKKEELKSFGYQSSPAPVLAEEKTQEAKQGGKDANNQLELPEAKKADNYEESKVAATQTKQEQQKEIVTTETVSNNALSDGEKDNDKSKAKKGTATRNNVQPAQVAFSNADVAVNTPSRDKNDESLVLQKNVSTGFSSYMASPDKKSNAKSYREPAFVGGDTAFVAYAKQHLKISSLTNSGIIVVEFLITKAGKAEKIKVIKPLNGCEACSQDVIDLIKSIDKWSPAAVDGNNSSSYKKISIQYN